MKTTKHQIGFGVLFCLLLMTGFLSNAFAVTSYMRVCMYWKVRYTDAGFGEDRLATTAEFTTGDAYGYYQVVDTVTSQTYSGYLNSVGCSAYISVVDGRAYNIYQGMAFQRDTAKQIIVTTDNTAPPTYSHNFIKMGHTYTPSGHTEGQYFMHNAPVLPNSFYSRVGAVAGEYMKLVSTLDVPDFSHIHLLGYIDESQWVGENPGGAEQRILIQYFGEDRSYQKFAIAHEIGHAVGAMFNANLRGGNNVYVYDEPGDIYELCNCKSFGGVDIGGSHCLNSREKIRRAESEGFAHFVASVLFNIRSSSNGYFVSYRNARIPMGPVWAAYYAPWSVNLKDTTLNRWMERNCLQRVAINEGVEWDWLLFFWDVWTDGEEKLEISQFKDIWPSDSMGDDDNDFNWTTLNDMVNRYDDITSIYERAWYELEPDERDNFYTKANSAGVDHGHQG